MTSASEQAANLSEITIKELVSSRYKGGIRPASWDRRAAGIDTVKSSTGEILKLQSDGGQPPPQTGWKIILTGGDAAAGYTWTLYALPSGAAPVR